MEKPEVNKKKLKQYFLEQVSVSQAKRPVLSPENSQVQMALGHCVLLDRRRIVGNIRIRLNGLQGSPGR